MPPKQSKAEVVKKQKAVEDKTFGLKNKNKSKTVQKYVQSLKQSGQPKPDPSKLQAQKKKEEEKAKEKELAELFKVAVKQPKVPVGVDPKSVLCEHFKLGQCAKGFKCKFSHDLNVQRKGEKIDIYSDTREEEQGTMEDWDQETLEKVVASKSNEYNNKNKPTDIFLRASAKRIMSRGDGTLAELDVSGVGVEASIMKARVGAAEVVGEDEAEALQDVLALGVGVEIKAFGVRRQPPQESEGERTFGGNSVVLEEAAAVYREGRRWDY
ncbi:hypothetical protein SASPL_102296 [Salvia splendens]|uniref:C3H1-type domain-containing protein n=1 Tax=Salvia splendens TaxID=180675 RepID=A0A8X9ADW5_SALSN|nr:hypothetical protein SASPL_102296 [Salvia splendens]